MTVRDNVRVAADARRQWSDAPPSSDVADEVLERVALTDVAHERAGSLPTGTARLVEVARAIATAPRLLLLDEPSSGLSEEETDRFADLLLGLAREGLGILLVEHDVELVMRVCARIHVLDFGRIIAAGTPSEVQRDALVQAAYLGSVPVE
jgi:branched-chain amino acid transport system ATP-binding protein